MKKTLLMAAMMVASLSASAQYEAGTLSIQPRVGVVGATLTNMPSVQISEAGNKKLDSEPIGGYFFGADAEYQLADRFSLAAGLNFSQAGSGWENYSFTQDGVKYEVKDTKVELGYINVPVTASYYIWKGLAVKSGVQFGFLTSAKIKSTLKASQGSTNSSTDMDEDFKDNCEKFDISIPVGLSYEFNNHLVLDARYNIGLNKVNKESAAGAKDCKNGVFTLTIGYKIKL